MQAIIDAIEADELDAKISVVIGNKECFALERARNHNLTAIAIPSKGKEREAFDKEVAVLLQQHEVDVILLIGYMRYLSPWFVDKYRNRIMNIHPSLLPKYAGGMDLNVHEEVLKNKENVTGATLHFVDEGADTGPIILQKEVPIVAGETPETLKVKVQKAEQAIILEAIKLYNDGRLKVVNQKVIIE